MTNDKTIRAWRKERDKAVASLDLKTFKKFYNKWLAKGMYDKSLPKDDYVTELALHKMALEITAMPDDVKTKAMEWLKAHDSRDRS